MDQGNIRKLTSDGNNHSAYRCRGTQNVFALQKQKNIFGNLFGNIERTHTNNNKNSQVN